MNLSASEKIQKKTLLFQCHLRKKMIIVKKLHTNYSLLIATDLCRLHCQILLIIYQEFVIKNAKNAWKEKKLG